MIEEGEILNQQADGCGICGQQDKYKCPACDLKTCSLQCCKEHKRITKCTGIRNQSKFIEGYEDKDVRRDFNYLSDMVQTTEGIQKQLAGITALPDALRYKLLKQQARRQGVDIMLAPKIMKKHRQNISFYSLKDKSLHWCIEFTYFGYSHVSRPISQKLTIKEALLGCELFQSEILDKHSINMSSQFIEQYILDGSLTMRWKSHPVVEFSEQNEYKFKHQKRRPKEQINGHQKQYYDVYAEQTIEDMIKGFTVYEFPTIELLIQVQNI